MLADLNVIDYERLQLGTPVVVADLPAGGRRLVQEAVGLRGHHQVGDVTFEDGEPTGEHPGRLLRGAASTAPRPVRPAAPRARRGASGWRRVARSGTGRLHTHERAADPVRGARRALHVGYQVWGAERSRVVDVLEFNSGLMISIDETWTSPTGSATQAVAGFAG